MTRTLLSRETLGALEAQLLRVGAAAVLDRLAPGLDRAEFARHEGELGFALPSEARTWWQWRNGGADVMPNVVMISLEQSIAAYHERRRHAYLAARQSSSGTPRLENPEFWWNAAWLPWVGPFSTHMVSLDCDVPRGAPSPIRRPDWTRTEEADYDTPRACSLGAVVEHWIHLLATDRVAFGTVNGGWPWISLNELLRGQDGS